MCVRGMVKVKKLLNAPVVPTILLTHFPLIHPRQPHLCRGHLPMVQPMSWAVQLDWGALKTAFRHDGDKYEYSCVKCIFCINTIYFFEIKSMVYVGHLYDLKVLVLYLCLCIPE